MASAAASKAVVFVHGILGSPEFFDFLLTAVPPERDVYPLTLKGHCGSARDFARAGMSEWKSQVSELMRQLTSRYDDVVIVAHSMGTLFAINEAVSGNASGIFLLNPPLRLRVSRRLFSTPVKVLLGKINDPLTEAAKAAYSITDSKNPLDYAGWLPRYLELFSEIRHTRPLVRDIPVKTQVFFSGRDEMVSLTGRKYFDVCANAETAVMSESGHYYYTAADRNRLRIALAQFLA